MEISIMSPSKLSDAQLVLLSSAAQHPQGAIKLDLKGAAAKKVAAKLLGEVLAEEVPSRGTLPEWRRDDGLGSLALCITKRGLAAIGVETSGPDRGAGLARGDAKGDQPGPTQAAPRLKAAGAAKRRKTESQHERRGTASRTSKQARVIDKLQRRLGATVAALMDSSCLNDLSTCPVCSISLTSGRYRVSASAASITAAILSSVRPETPANLATLSRVLPFPGGGKLPPPLPK
jgi:hypothetical protein